MRYIQNNGQCSPERNVQKEGVVQAVLLKSLRGLQVSDWNHALYTREARDLLQEPKSDFCQQLLAEAVAVTINSRRGSELEAISTILQSLLPMPFSPGGPLKTAIETCIKACLNPRPQEAVALAKAAVEARVQLKSKIVLSTISQGVKSARDPGELGKILELFCVATLHRALSLNKPETHKVLNVILAVTCDPQVARNVQQRRVGPRYTLETSVVEALYRLSVGVAFAEAIVASGVKFVSPQDEARINLVIRGAVSLGTVCALEGKRVHGEIGDAEMRSRLAKIGVKRDYPQPTKDDYRGRNWQEALQDVLLRALEVARYCFEAVEESDGAVRIQPRPTIRGITISRLILALDMTGVDLTDWHRDEVAALVFCGLSVKECREEFSAASIHAAIQIVSAGESSVLQRAERVACIVQVGLEIMRDGTLLASIIDMLAEAAIEDPSLDEQYVPLVGSLEERIKLLEEVSADGAKQWVNQEGRSLDSSTWFSELLDESQSTQSEE